MLAQTLGRAVSDRFKRHTAFALRRLRSGAWGGAEEPHAERDDHGRSLRVVLGPACSAASVNAQEHRGPLAQILWPLIGHPLRRLAMRREARSGAVGCPSPEPGPNWRTTSVQPRL
jgi:hypothetical protein